jgi:fructose-1,6-bisphosphatase I
LTTTTAVQHVAGDRPTQTTFERHHSSGATSEPITQILAAVLRAAYRLTAILADPENDLDQVALQAHDVETTTANGGGDIPQPMDIRAHRLFLEELRRSPIQSILSEEADDVIVVDPDARHVIAIDPLDGSSNLSINGAVGTIFSVMPAIDLDRHTAEEAYLRTGVGTCAAGFVLYGPATIVALTVGTGVEIYRLDPTTAQFVLVDRDVVVPDPAREYAINASNYRYWDAWVRMYVDDLCAGAGGPRRADFNMRWVAALVADAYRILIRGGIYLYPADHRPGYRTGRLRLVYEAYPIAFLIEQAGGAATDGEQRILGKRATAVHERTPLIFGSRSKVDNLLRDYREHDPTHGERAPLFTPRGLFRS